MSERPATNAAPRLELTELEATVRRLRFDEDRSVRDVAAALSLSRERIRQIEARALRKLKHPSRSRKLRSFLDN